MDKIAEYQGRQLTAAEMWEMMGREDFLARPFDPLGLFDAPPNLVGYMSGQPVNMLVPPDVFASELDTYVQAAMVKVQELLGMLG